MGCGASAGRRVGPEESSSKENARAEPLSPPSTMSPPYSSAEATPNFTRRTERIKWRKGDLIGNGANGRVYLGLEEDTGAIIAVKELVFSKNDHEELEQMQEEIELLRSLQHPNIVTYLGTDVSDDAQTLFIFTEWVPGGSIQALVTKFGRLPEAVVRKYVAQLLVGLQYLHEKQVIHRDIKAANILVDDRGSIKLADFGSSKRIDAMGTASEENTSLRGTPYFMAPEVITQTGYGRKADIWSTGCTVLQMVTGQPPWKSLQLGTPAALLYHIANTEEPPPLPDTLSLELRAMLLRCFRRDVDTRPSADELLRDPFFQAGGAAAEALKAGRVHQSAPNTLSTPGGAQDAALIIEACANNFNDSRSNDTTTPPITNATPAPPPALATVGAENSTTKLSQSQTSTTKKAKASISNNNNNTIPPTETISIPLPSEEKARRSTIQTPAEHTSTTRRQKNGPGGPDDSDEALITMFLSHEAATQFAGADKHFPGRPPTARPKGAPPRVKKGERRRRASRERSSSEKQRSERRPKKKKEPEPPIPEHRDTSNSLPVQPRRTSSSALIQSAGGKLGPSSRSTSHIKTEAAGTTENWAARTVGTSSSGSKLSAVVPTTNAHDETPILTHAAMREKAAELQNEKMQAELTEARVRQNEQFQAELNRFKEMQISAVPSSSANERRQQNSNAASSAAAASSPGLEERHAG